MKPMILPGLLAIAMMVPTAAAEECIPTYADPSTQYSLTVNGHLYYFQGVCKRDDGQDHCLRNDAGDDLLGAPGLTGGVPHPTTPGEGFVVGDGTSWYEETNGMDQLQRGSQGISNIISPYNPIGCDASWHPDDHPALPGGTGPCLVQGFDPIEDETCGFGPDMMYLFVGNYQRAQ